MKADTFLELRQKVISAGYGEEIAWQEGVTPCDNALAFFQEYMWVVICSGMKEQIARLIQERILDAWERGKPMDSVYRHKGKIHAISTMVKNREVAFEGYKKSAEKLAFLKTLPYIGDITKYHLAKNLGLDVAKPDRHLTRIASFYDTTPEELCERLSKETGYRVGTVDIILWRAANLGMI